MIRPGQGGPSSRGGSRTEVEAARHNWRPPLGLTGSGRGLRNGQPPFPIQGRARPHGGWKAFGSSTGFRLPDGSVFSPAASVVDLARWRALPEDLRRGFAPLCPDLVVELASPSDEGPRGLTALRQTMDADQRNGARLGWLLIPQERAVEVWGPLEGGERGRRIQEATRLEGAIQFARLALYLEPICAA